MNFEFNDDQRMLRDQARRFLLDKSPPEVVRETLETEQPYDKDLWRQFGEMGWLGAAIPEAYGGSGLGHLELCVLAEELGRALAPTPFASSIYLGAEALMVAGSEEQKQGYLPDIATGEAIWCLALSEGPRPATEANIAASVSNGKLSGEKLPVADGDIANRAIVVAKDGGAAGLYIVDLNGAGVERTTVETMDPTRSQARLVFTDAPAEKLGDEGWPLLERIQDRAAVLIAFEQVGGAETALDMAKEYALGRFAFGRPIAGYQAIKHRLADMYIQIELARSNSYYGAWALSTDAAELPVAAATARVSATEAYHFASKENIQIHGGMGFTWEFNCHLYYRRARHLALVLGSQRRWKDRLIRALERRNAA
ncbi:MAG: acyl-CoA/acyl-ACP dehydrogenase [Rhodospirillaceae bacterium]|jgi:acyl-CoA dehydrogenase|nr:acyl-CoA/acyl-ACP dehydrogenase [Rhodospirillaceae bacterium]MBT5894598.1 acyl-CoA/acyl-ACP dehydrogenase [Rhodospirillaceae bacterium]MBT6429361.1 acyl-CoA/acyl-ACP dehydrogenase [Rhodospirillaceae bacterium]MBT7759967.1 acyl-CoA/acyl-ACP dehydrogenase [Rhodospirillaceae bacterium]